MKKRLLTLDDLIDFHASTKTSMHYSASDPQDSSVVVQLEGALNFSKDDYDPELGLLKVHIKSSHIETNRNNSEIPRDVMEQAAPSIYNRPILGYIHQLSDKSYDFAGHEMKINSDGEMEYEEIALGVIPESGDAHLVYDSEMDKTYLEVDGYIYEEYTRAAEILKEKKESKVSVELALLDYSFNAKKKTLVINKFYFSGVTILGKERGSEIPIEEGMLGSKLTLADFTAANNSMFESLYEQNNLKLIESLETLNNTLSNFNINNQEFACKTNGKEDVQLENNNETVAEKNTQSLMNKEEFEADMNSEEAEKVDSKETETTVAYEENGSSEEEDSEAENSENEDGKDVEDSDEEEDSANDEEDSEVQEDKEDETEDKPSDATYSHKHTLDISGHKVNIEFQLSHDDIRNGLYELLEAYCSLDDDWYWISEVFDDHLVFEGVCNGKIYRQNYTVEADIISLVGDRIELFRELLTASEMSQLEEMRANYSSIKDELTKYQLAELNTARMEVLSDPAYCEFIETEEFKEIKENVQNYSVDELRTKCDLAFAKLMKEKAIFSASKPKTEVKTISYAFGEHNSNTTFLDGLLKNK